MWGSLFLRQSQNQAEQSSFVVGVQCEGTCGLGTNAGSTSETKWSPEPPLPVRAQAPVDPEYGPWAVVNPHDPPDGQFTLYFVPRYDPLYMRTLAAYFAQRGITSFLWWTWNANGGDTGGLTTTEPWQWAQTPGQPLQKVLPRVPPNGTPWLDVRPSPGTLPPDPPICAACPEHHQALAVGPGAWAAAAESVAARAAEWNAVIGCAPLPRHPAS